MQDVKKIVSGPDFIGIGGQRCGTSWIYACLYEHPEIYIPVKEIHFFSRESNWRKGYSWYEEFFKNRPIGTKTGEFSTSYISSYDAPKRIYIRYPNIKLIVSLRNPVDRAFSSYLNDIMAGKISANIPFEAALKFRYSEYIERGFYGRFLLRYLKYFDRSQLLILIYEDSLKKPKQFIQSIYNFIGVKSDYTPSMLYKRVNRGRIPRLIWIDKFLNVSSNYIRKIGLSYLWWQAKKLGLGAIIRRWNSKEVHDRISPSLRSELYGIFEEDIQLVKEITGRELTEWKV